MADYERGHAIKVPATKQEEKKGRLETKIEKVEEEELEGWWPE